MGTSALFDLAADLKFSLPPLVFKVGSYGGKLKYTISYVAGSRGTLLEDADIQIIVSTLSLIDVCLSW